MDIPLLSGKRILLGVTGSIACYKAADLASRLRQAGALVDVLLSEAATHFVSPLTFQSVTGRRAYQDEDLWSGQGHVVHVGLAVGADIYLVAPCTADTLARLATGRADSLIALTALAARCPLLLAPAMDAGMWDHPATQANVETLAGRGVRILGPAEGSLASGLVGSGRMLEPDELFGHLRLALAEGGPLTGRNIVVTAGGTQEPIDPVRVITNRSSGRQGYALAQAALDLGAGVTLITAPTCINVPAGTRAIRVNTAEEMLHAVLDVIPGADVLIMAAAVADFRPQAPSQDKIKRKAGIPEVSLEATADILEAVGQKKHETGYPRLMVGFAAESDNLLENARGKLVSRGLDLIAANDISQDDAGFEVETNRVTLLFPDKSPEALPLMSKTDVARRVLKEIQALLGTTGR